MGRVKLKIKRLESTSNRQVTYSKRRNGILKKAKELSILCDVDIVLLMFSPTGRSTLFHGDRSRTEEVIAKFAQVSPQERAKRKLESLETLKKTFKKLDHDVIVQDFMGASSQTAEELQNQAQLVQSQLSELHRRLSYWNNPGKVENIEHLSQMESSLKESLERVRLHKETMAKHQVISLGCTGLGGTTLPLVMSDMQTGQPLTWFSKTDTQPVILANVPNLLAPGTMACSKDDSVPGFSGYFSLGKPIEVVSSGPFDSAGHEGSSSGGALTELSSSGSLSLQPSEHYSYTPYSSLNLLQDKQSKNNEMEMNFQGTPGANEVNSSFALPRSTFESGHDPWIPAAGHCGIPMFDDKSYHQQPN